jgi:ABC-type antimicrobial peptide transport system, permease component
MIPDVTRCADLRAGHLGGCTDPAATVVVEGNDMAEPAGRGTAPAVPVPAASLSRLPLAGLVAFTDGKTATVDRVRTTMAAATPARRVAIHTLTDIAAQRDHGRVTIQRLVSAVLLLTLLIAGCSLAVSVAGGLLERKRPFALLRLTGASPADLNKVALTETTAPLLTASVISAGLGLAMAALILKSAVDKSGQSPWKPPDPLYFAALGSGLLLAILITATTALPLLAKLTSLENARFE